MKKLIEMPSKNYVYGIREISVITGMTSTEVTDCCHGEKVFNEAALNRCVQSGVNKKTDLFSRILSQLDKILWRELESLKVVRVKTSTGKYNYPHLKAGLYSLIRSNSTAEQKQELYDIILRSKFNQMWSKKDRKVWEQSQALKIWGK